MDNQTILATLQRINYACLYVELCGASIKFGPGLEQWRADIRVCSPDMRARLVERIRRVQELTQQDMQEVAS